MPGTMETPARRPPTSAALSRREVPPPSLPRTRPNPVTVGFWLGGVALGCVGCLVGAPHSELACDDALAELNAAREALRQAGGDE